MSHFVYFFYQGQLGPRGDRGDTGTTGIKVCDPFRSFDSKKQIKHSLA